MKPANFAPVYCSIYPELAEIARKHGYAMAIHGTMARDFDLICIPWADEPSQPDAVVKEITATYATTEITHHSQKQHGRMAYSVCFGFGDFFADLSFMPRLTKQKLKFDPHAVLRTYEFLDLLDELGIPYEVEQ